MPDAVATSTSFVVAQLAGPGRYFVLRDRALPYKPAGFGGKQRLTMTWYPGNPIGTAQVLGPEETPSKFNGTWKDRFISGGGTGSSGQPMAATGNGATPNQVQAGTLVGVSVVDTMALCTFIDQMRRDGIPVRMAWDAIVRDGFLREFNFRFLRREIAEWDMDFEWYSQGEPRDLAPTTNAKPDVAGTFSAAAQQVGNLQQTIANIGDTVSSALQVTDVTSDADAIKQLVGAVTFQQKQIEAAVNVNIQDVTNGIAAVGDVAGSLSDATLEPSEAARRTNALLLNAADTAESSWEQVESVLARDLYAPGIHLGPGSTLQKQIFAISTMSYGQSLAAESNARSLKDSFRDSANSFREQASSMAGQTDEGALLAVFIARNGQDLRQVSQQFYGTPDSWLDLAVYNNLTDSRLSGGQVVFVPVTLPPAFPATNPPPATPAAAVSNF